MLELYLSTPKCQLDWYFKFLFLKRFYFDIHYTTPYPKRAKKTTRFWLIYRLIKLGEQAGGAVVRALASHQCGPGSNPGVDAICGLRLLLVLSLAPRGFSPGIPVFSSPQKPILPNSNSIWNARTGLNESKRTLKCFVGKKAIYVYIFYI